MEVDVRCEIVGLFALNFYPFFPGGKEKERLRRELNVNYEGAGFPKNYFLRFFHNNILDNYCGEAL